MSWNKEEKCMNCGIRYEKEKPIFKECFEEGFCGGVSNVTGKPISICDFGSLIFCKWKIEKTDVQGLWKVQGDNARILLPTEENLYEIISYEIKENGIIVKDSNNNEHKICCCECIFVEWQ